MTYNTKYYRTLSLLFSLILLVIQLESVVAQDNSCDSTTVVRSFADAVVSNTTDAWLASYTNGNCSDAIKAGALGIFESYRTMGETDVLVGSIETGDSIDMPIIGDTTVIRTNNVLGLEQEITVINTTYYGDTLVTPAILNYSDISRYNIGLRINDVMWAVIPFGNFRSLTNDTSGQATVSLANGVILTGEVSSTVEGVDVGLLALANTTEVRLLSLSEEPVLMDTSTGTWLLEISDSESYTVTNPRIVYQYNGTRSNCVGACGITLTSTLTDFSVEVSGQTAELDIYTPDQIAFRPNAEVDLALPNGNEVTGVLLIGGFSKHLAVDLIEQGYTLVINIEQASVTLIKQD